MECFVFFDKLLLYFHIPNVSSELETSFHLPVTFFFPPFLLNFGMDIVSNLSIMYYGGLQDGASW